MKVSLMKKKIETKKLKRTIKFFVFYVLSKGKIEKYKMSFFTMGILISVRNK